MITLRLVFMEIRLLTRREVAELTRLSTRTVDEHVARGKLCPVRIGRAVRFTPDEVRRWLNIHAGEREARRD
ncbi:MAG: helix-turn-helix domain-containing protein [Alphaproteobacteria bacterium]|nr:helix-turn-helix domain-containing protein [Alphaproteobacteria bacterium]